MDQIQQSLAKFIEDLPFKLIAEVADKKLRAEGITLSQQELLALARRMVENGGESGRVVYDDADSRDVCIALDAEEMEAILAKLRKVDEDLPSLVQHVAEKKAPRLFKKLKQRWPGEREQQRRDMDAFKESLDERWGKGLDALKMLIMISRELGSEINHDLRLQSGGATPKTFDVLTKLHARACQVAEEIHCLLSHGFADGAMARWRTMHEIACVAAVIGQHGEALAERYAAHGIVESHRVAKDYAKHHVRLQHRPFEPGEFEEVEKRYQEALAKYGKDFRETHGWASVALGKPSPTLADIQVAAGIDHFSPYWRFAGDNVHANPRGVFFKLGLIDQAEILLAGPSNAGLADPGHATALSLMQVSASLLPLAPTLDHTIMVQFMMQLADEIGEALLAAQQKLDEDDAALRRAQQTNVR